MSLFDYRVPDFIPLADKMRPTTLDEFYGQSHLLGEGKILRTQIEQDQVTSMILQGPPSTGKTSLAHLIRRMTSAHFVELNAVTLSIKDLREKIITASEHRKMYNERTMLFIDELHAMKSNVQMALLPAVEQGVVILIGATTESVTHDIIPPLVSRCRVYRLHPLGKEELKTVLSCALSDPQRGLGGRGVTMEEAAIEYLADVCNGDIRSALCALESAISSSSEEITLEKMKEAYELRINSISTSDFYDLISALIKSMRGSQTDAAIYWLARLLDAGVDPLYVARRVVVHAAEDVGMANPHALPIAIAAKQAVEFLGMPEARLPLAEAVIYIAESPKSNSAYRAIGKAMDVVTKTTNYDVPRSICHGSTTYKNPIDKPGVVQEYLPQELQEVSFYTPQNSGVESKIYARQHRINS